MNRATREELRRAIPSDLAERIDVQDPVAPHRVIEGLHGHHVGLLFDRPVTRNAELSSPNKLFEYLMAGLAIVARALEGLAFVDEERVGVTFEPGSPASIAEALERLAADPVLLGVLRANARSAAVERYNADAQRDALATAWRR